MTLRPWTQKERDAMPDAVERHKSLMRGAVTAGNVSQVELLSHQQIEAREKLEKQFGAGFVANSANALHYLMGSGVNEEAEQTLISEMGADPYRQTIKKVNTELQRLLKDLLGTEGQRDA